MFTRHGWGFHDRITEQYGNVVRIYGPMKVQTVFPAVIYRTFTYHCEDSRTVRLRPPCPEQHYR